MTRIARMPLSARCRFLALSALLTAAPTLVPSAALACKCAPPPDAKSAASEAAAVFEGRVLAVDSVAPRDEGAPPDKRITLSVVRAWKGIESERAELRTRGESAACGVDMQVGESYLVYAAGSAGDLTVSLCSRTVPMAEAGADVAALGAGITPVTITAATADAGVSSEDGGAPKADGGAAHGEVTKATPRAGGCAGSTSGSQGASLLLFGLPSLAFLGRRRRR